MALHCALLQFLRRVLPGVEVGVAQSRICTKVDTATIGQVTSAGTIGNTAALLQGRLRRRKCQSLSCGRFRPWSLSEASRIAKGSKVDWWVERTDKGVCFCFESREVKKHFASFCGSLGVQHHDG